MRAILDTNVVVQSVISSAHTAPARTLDALHAGVFQLVYSAAIIDEWLDVLNLPAMRTRHGMSDDELVEFVASLIVRAESWPGRTAVSPSLTRDLTDTKFASLALESEADFLVSNDHRHLLPLKTIGKTKVVTPAAFLRALDAER
ncbi:MAG: putative toxin-antitoxin system toxin component, PIN family [Gemmataceae bacterium]